jgi:hypothetical protein
VKNQAARLKELEDLRGGSVSQAKRNGSVFTARVAFKKDLEAITAQSRLQRLGGWGVSKDGKTLRCLVVVA